MTPPKAKDGRETLQERLRARINKHIDPRGNVCVGQYNHWDSALDLDAIRDLDAAQAEIARLQAGINKAIDAPLSYNREWILEYLHLVLAENEPAQAPLPARADVVERAEKEIQNFLDRRGVGGVSYLAERIVAILDEASLLRQPEAAPEGFTLVPNVALKWLHGEGPDHEGKWFGEVGNEGLPTKRPRPYWWRSHFRKIREALPAPTPASAEMDSDQQYSCPECEGSGADKNKLNDPGPCQRCEGSGYVNFDGSPASAQDELVMALNAALEARSEL